MQDSENIFEIELTAKKQIVKMGATKDEMQMVWDIIRQSFNLQQMQYLRDRLNLRLSDLEPF